MSSGWGVPFAACEDRPVRVLLVADLHYDLKKFDWLLGEAARVDVLVVAGDLLDISSAVPLDAQITVVLEYLARYAAAATTVVCSGNHDLDHRTDDGEKATAWLAEARDRGAVVDGDSVVVGDWLVTACAWWEGPVTLARLEADLDAAAQQRTGRWLWVYHGPAVGPLSWTGRRHYGDPELPRLLERHRPDLVLGGHVHEAPFVDGGSWNERRGDTWLFNGGHQRGAVPSHTWLDLDGAVASWWSWEQDDDVSFGGAAEPSVAPVGQS
jgi:Icc-related predicted phosphoesterase